MMHSVNCRATINELFFFFNDTATTEIYTLSLHDALPIAGITMATALASLLANIPVRRDVAMTGEVTLRGRVLAIGGLKEKILAAKRAKLSTVILPKRNEKDLEEIPKHLMRGIQLVFGET